MAPSPSSPAGWWEGLSCSLCNRSDVSGGWHRGLWGAGGGRDLGKKPWSPGPRASRSTSEARGWVRPPGGGEALLASSETTPQEGFMGGKRCFRRVDRARGRLIFPSVHRVCARPLTGGPGRPPNLFLGAEPFRRVETKSGRGGGRDRRRGPGFLTPHGTPHSTAPRPRFGPRWPSLPRVLAPCHPPSGDTGVVPEGECGPPRGGGPEFTASGVPRETCGSWDRAFPPDLRL